MRYNTYTAGEPVAGNSYTFTVQAIPRQAVPLVTLRPNVFGLGLDASSVNVGGIVGVGVGLLAIGGLTIMLLRKRGKKRR